MSKKKKVDDKKSSDKIGKFDIKINEFGELSSNLPIEDLNHFLDENLEDKKLKSSFLEEE